tara:strand:- start:9146 stop:9655 length:510 start_codon:yes stop_codon:yes gene_type:complete
MKVKIIKLKSYSHIKKWVSWLNDKDVTKFSEQRFTKHTESSQKKFIKKKLKDKNSICFKIFLDNIFVGVIEIGKIDYNHNTCEIMYFIGEKKFWGKGLGSNSIELVIQFIKNKLKLKKIYAGIYSLNNASRKVLLKNKFKKECVIRKLFSISHISKHKFDDKIIFSLKI